MIGVNSRIIYQWLRQKKIHPRGRPGGQVRICVDSLLAAAQSARAERSLQPYNLRIELMEKLIREQFSDCDLNLKKLASQVEVSTCHLSRLFKKTLGCGFRAYLRDIRLARAEVLLRETLLSIKEIAWAVGYKHVSDFDHHFKQRNHVKPKDYRDSQYVV